MCESLSRCSAASGVSRCRVGEGRARAVGWGRGARAVGWGMGGRARAVGWGMGARALLGEGRLTRLNTVYTLTLASGSVFNQMKNKYLNKI